MTLKAMAITPITAKNAKMKTIIFPKNVLSFFSFATISSAVFKQELLFFRCQTGIAVFGDLVQDGIHITLSFSLLSVVFAIVARHPRLVLDFLVRRVFRLRLAFPRFKNLLPFPEILVGSSRILPPIQNQQQAEQQRADSLERMKMVAYIDRENNLGINPFKFSISVGYVLTDPASDKNVDDYVEEADVMMYEIKNEYHKTHPGIS